LFGFIHCLFGGVSSWVCGLPCRRRDALYTFSSYGTLSCQPDKKDWEVTKEFRKWVTGFPLERVGYLDFTLEIPGCIEGVVLGFRRSVIENQPKLYKPWTQKNSRWAG